jgi:hypothetical protein
VAAIKEAEYAVNPLSIRSAAGDQVHHVDRFVVRFSKGRLKLDIETTEGLLRFVTYNIPDGDPYVVGLGKEPCSGRGSPSG